MTRAHKIQVAILLLADITCLSYFVWEIEQALKKKGDARMTNSDASTEQ